MTEQELLQRAKEYIDKLANGINPLTGEYVSENDVVNNVRIARCLFYVSDVLGRVLTKGFPTKKQKKLPFFLSEEALSKLEYSETPLPITQFVQRINALIDENAMEKLSYKTVQGWLVQAGVLEEANGRYAKTKFCPTELGEQIGITIKERVNNYNSVYYVVYYELRAQKFIVNHLQELPEPDKAAGQ